MRPPCMLFLRDSRARNSSGSVTSVKKEKTVAKIPQWKWKTPIQRSQRAEPAKIDEAQRGLYESPNPACYLFIFRKSLIANQRRRAGKLRPLCPVEVLDAALRTIMRRVADCSGRAALSAQPRSRLNNPDLL